MITFLIFSFGVIVGSFLNVVILRYNTGESIVKGGSVCFSCGKKLKWHELVPILSFLIQNGKCRECKSKISWQYPVVELLTGIIFVAIFLTGSSLLSILYFLLIFSLLIIITVYDLRHQIIPDGIVYTFILLSFLSPVVTSFSLIFTLSYYLAGLYFFAFFGGLWLVSRGTWMGFGDAKLVLGIGWLLGLRLGLLALLLSFWFGAIISIFLLFLSKKRYNIKSKVAFGPFLVLGTLIAFFYGEAIIKLII